MSSRRPRLSLSIPWRVWRRKLIKVARRATLLLAAGVVLSFLALGALLLSYFTRTPGVEEVAVIRELEIPTGTRSVTLYFAAANAESLVAENRQILEPASVSQSARALIEELVIGPRGSSLRRVLPAETHVRHVFFDEEGQVYIDFSPALRKTFRGGSTAEYLLLSSLVRTLSANLPTVAAISLTSGGRPMESLGGHFPVKGSLEVSQWR